MNSRTLFFILILTLSHWCFGQNLTNNSNNQNIRKFAFNNISVNDGLSQFAVMSITQDNNGFIWIGTFDGLNRYDGLNIKAVRHLYNDTSSLMNNRILSLAVKSNDELLIGSQDGLILHDLTNGLFKDISTATNELKTSVINSLLIDCDSNIWIGTNKGLVIAKKNLYGNKEKNSEYTYQGYNSSKNMNIMSFCEDMRGDVWIATNSGVYIATRKGKELSLELLDGTSGISAWVTYRDNKNNIWVGGDNYLAVVNNINNYRTIKQIKTQIYNEEPLNIRAIVEDTINSTFWIGTWKNALFNISLDQNNNVSNIKSYKSSHLLGDITDNDITVLFIDHSNVLWVGTRDGVSYTDLSPRKFQHLKTFENNSKMDLFHKKEYINSLFVDSKNKLWISIYMMGLYMYDLNTKTIEQVSHKVTRNSVIEIIETNNGDLLFGTNNELLRMSNKERNNANGKAEIIFSNSHLPAIKYPSMLVNDLNGDIWLSFDDQIIRYAADSKKKISYTVKDGLPPTADSYQIFYTPDSSFIWINVKNSGISKVYFNSQNENIKVESFATSSDLANRFVWEIFIDKHNIMWIGTDTGIDKIDLNVADKIVTHFNHPLLQNSKITSIISDNFNNLWVGSSQGLYNINTKTNEVLRFTHEDGLQSNSFTDAITKTKDGIIYVGGINGINYFNPAIMAENKFQSKGVFIGFKINNKDIAINEEVWGSTPLSRDINKVDKIVLNYKQNNFTLEFAALHYAAPKRNRHKYKLEGYDVDWVEVDFNHRFASYSNLPSGTYKFKLLTSNNDGIWNETPRTITLTITPPPWETWWAYSIYTILACIVLFFILKYISEKQLWKNKLIIQQLEKQKEHELNELKLSFFTNITHELRTPLVLILGPLRDLISWGGSHEEFISYRLNIINRNANKLLDLINQILNIRSMSTNHLPLSVAKKNIVKVVEDTVKSFLYFADKKEISLIFTVDTLENITETWFDKDKIEKILHNLISNALKFTSEKGRIEVKLWQKKEIHTVINISVEDNGKGIDPTLLKNVFDLYSKGALNNEFSSGIGLCFSKVLIEAHKGSIKVDSELEKGSVFTIAFPVDKECFAPESIIVINAEDEPETFEEMKIESDKSKRLILIVEDNNDMRKYIKESLKNDFDIVEAKDGVEGLALAKKVLPNAIITDLMMPGIDGATLLDSIRKDTRTSFIPVVVHSVLDDKDTIRKLLSKGANEYVVKPFEPNILIYKINSLLSIQDDFAKKMHNESLLKPEEVEVESSDDKLLKQISKIIEDNLQNPNLDADMVSTQIGMSRMQLYRRLKQISGGKQLSEIILGMRLERAAQLLSTGEKRISEVMDETGFNNNTRFKNYFTNAFGVSPNDYIKSHKN